MILWISGIVLIISIMLMIWKREESSSCYVWGWFETGLMGSIFSVILGFLLLGMVVPVSTSIDTYKPTEITRTRNSTILVYRVGLEEKTLVCDDALTYNADTNKISVQDLTDHNSYGMNMEIRVRTLIED